MRIGIYDRYLDDLGGGEKYMMSIAEHFSLKHEVTVFWDKKSDLDKLSKRFSLSLDNIKIKKNIFSTTVSTFERLFATKNFDIIIVLSDGSIPLVSSRKLFLHIQQPLTSVHALSKKDKLKLSRVTGIFYNSVYTKSHNKGLFVGVKNVIIYPPVEIFFNKKEKENIIIHVGRFRVLNLKNDDYKKQQVMIDSFIKMVKAGLKNWKFILAISINNEDEPAFKKMLNSAKDYPIEFLVNKNNKELWDVYNRAKIYWHASGYGEDLDMHPEFAEHFGISTVEAMGAGVVPVVINSGGQREIISNTTNGFLWDDLVGLMDKTTLLINDAELLKKMSNSAKVRAKDYSKEKFFQRLEEIML